MNLKLFIVVIGFNLLAFPVFAGKHLPILVTLTVTNPTCGQLNGRIVVIASGGTAPYNYSYNGNPPQPSNVFIYLGPGAYTITVTDAALQTGNAATTLTNQFTAPTGVTSTSTPTSGCAIADASLTLTGSGGTPPYMYSIDRTNFQASNLFPNLYAGSYWLAIKDVNGCISPFILVTANIGIQCAIHHSGINQSSICFPYKSYLGLINVFGGTAPYLYSLDGINFQTNSVFFPLAAGLHTVTVKDAANLILKYTVALRDPCPYAYTVNTAVVAAQCGQNGSITVSASEGASPYTYSIDAINFQSSNQFTGLAPGNYTVTVKDADGILVTKFCIVGDVPCITVTATAVSSTCGASNGSISAQASGGVAPYQYSLGAGPFSPNNQFSNLAAGPYTVHAKDANGGMGNFNVTVTDIPGPSVNSVVATPTSCTNANGTITVNAQNGTAPLQFSIDGVNFQSNPVFNGIAGGTYTTIVKDANGCIATSSVTVTLNNTINANAGANTTICQGKSVTLNGTSNGTSFSWSPTTGLSNPNILSPVASPISTTDYILTATSGICTAISTTRITVNLAPIAFAGRDTSICLGQSVQLNATGGTSYIWSPATYLDDWTLMNPVVIDPPAGNYQYTVTVKDNNGCSSLASSVVHVNVFSLQVYAGPDAVVQSGQSLQLHGVDINNSGFISYAWTPAIGLDYPASQNPVATLSNDMVYMLKATSATGCTAMDDISIKVFRDIDIYVPSAFTPNNDGHNDLLKAIPVGIKEFKYLNIFDRAGQLIFRTYDATSGWDGNYKGTPLYGMYVWTAEGIDHKGNAVHRNGTVLIIR